MRCPPVLKAGDDPLSNLEEVFMAVVKVGFIGSGGIANAHMNALSQIPEAKLVAFCDVQLDRAKAAVQRFGGAAYRDYRKLLEKEDLDAVYICLPPFAHGDQELQALKKRCHLFIEKPIALSLEKAQQINAAIKRGGAVCSVGYHWRYQDTTDRARSLLEGRTVGMVLGYWMGGMPGVAWWRRLKQSGGQMVEQTTHIFDLARYLCGDVKRVTAAYATRALMKVPQFDVSDVGTAVLEFKSGAVGQISTSCLLGQGYTVGLTIACHDFLLETDGGSLRLREPGHNEDWRATTNPMLREDQVFIKACQTRKTGEIRSPYSDALKTLAVTLACNESAKKGKPIIVKS